MLLVDLTIEEMRGIAVRMAQELRDGRGTPTSVSVWEKMQVAFEDEDETEADE